MDGDQDQAGVDWPAAVGVSYWREEVTRTRLLMTIVVISVAIYDLIVVSLGGVNISVSAWFESFGSYPAIVFGVGFVCGHFFGYFRKGMPAGARVQLLNLAEELRGLSNVPEDGRALSIARMHLRGWAERIETIAGK